MFGYREMKKQVCGGFLVTDRLVMFGVAERDATCCSGRMEVMAVRSGHLGTSGQYAQRYGQ